MNALVEEARGEPEVLERFSRSKFPKARAGSIFVGAGDSYAAALAGFYAARGRHIALDPYALGSAPGMARGRDVFLISVSGKTASNLGAARSVAGSARRMTAITAVADSELARLTDATVRLPMAYAPRRAGLLSFSLSLLAVLKIAGVAERCDFASALERARRDRGKISMAPGTTYFLGNSLAYPAALYAAAKTYELLGATAHAELLEEFSHMELLSMRRSDSVNVFASFDPADASGKLRSALAGQGYDVSVIPDGGATDEERLFHAVFVAQLAVLDEAKRQGLSEPSFMTSGGRLGVSDSMIY